MYIQPTFHTRHFVLHVFFFVVFFSEDFAQINETQVVKRTSTFALRQCNFNISKILSYFQKIIKVQISGKKVRFYMDSVRGKNDFGARLLAKSTI